jgi:hypothetical protein
MRVGLAAAGICRTKLRMGEQTASSTTNPLVEGYRSLRDRPDRAVDLAREALAVRPDAPAALRLLGLGLRATGLADEAADVEQRAFHAATQDPVLLRAGDALVAGRLQEAEPPL